jgi:hypothetical protein
MIDAVDCLTQKNSTENSGAITIQKTTPNLGSSQFLVRLSAIACWLNERDIQQHGVEPIYDIYDQKVQHGNVGSKA